MITLSESPRILIVRLSAIGDTIHSLPLAVALRRAFPSCFLGWIVERPSAALIEDNPLFDWTMVMPKGWLKSPAEVVRLRREVVARRFEIAFDPQGLTKSAAAAWLSGAPVRVGFTRGESRELAPVLDNVLLEPMGRHAVDMTLSLLRAVGVSVPAWAEFVFPACGVGDLAAIDGVLADVRYRDGFILMGPWGSFPSKLWPLDRFRELALRLYGETGLSSLVLGHGDIERGRVAELADGTDGVLALAPDVSVLGVVGLAGRARLFVGCDSFPMHAAAAAGCRALGLFGVTDPVRLGPYGVGCRSLYERLTLVGSSRERRGLGVENMGALSVGRVLAVCLEMLSS